MGRKPYKAEVELLYDGIPSRKEVQFFGWEQLDEVERIAEAFRLG